MSLVSCDSSTFLKHLLELWVQGTDKSVEMFAHPGHGVHVVFTFFVFTYKGRIAIQSKTDSGSVTGVFPAIQFSPYDLLVIIN